ncbi:pheromone A receptor-domain-containing protein [Jimgerdemannia flammicorona]|uniref:Pheromone A receptor-domain-containing protein n=1 Tax=Jimgerdemannia flammicorona TaxID=994334 RepID=A0A433QF11_9FUNG|nr:pheromone A receptor-domain-containing protein [Jimgerdemannia flammicorona]
MADSWLIIFTSTIGLACCIVPFCIFARSCRLSAVMMSLWTALANVRILMNAILWPNGSNSDDRRAYCTVFTSLEASLNVAIVSCCMCMIYGIWVLISQPRIMTKTDKKHRCLIEICGCVIWPLTYMALQIIVRPRAYDIAPINGCFLPVEKTWRAIVVILIAHTLPNSNNRLGITIYKTVRTNLEFDRILQGQRQVTRSIFNRLTCFSMVYFCYAVPSTIYIFSIEVMTVISGSESQNLNFWSPIFYQQPVNQDYRLHANAAIAVVWFACFGTNGEAKKLYALFGERTGLSPRQNVEDNHQPSSTVQRSGGETQRSSIAQLIRVSSNITQPNRDPNAPVTPLKQVVPLEMVEVSQTPTDVVDSRDAVIMVEPVANSSAASSPKTESTWQARLSKLPPVRRLTALSISHLWSESEDKGERSFPEGV